jgi:hypothetical protein
MRAERGQLVGDGAADAARGARDERDLAIERVGGENRSMYQISSSR